MADLSWREGATRRLPAGVGFAIAGGASLFLWALIAGVAQLF